MRLYILNEHSVFIGKEGTELISFVKEQVKDLPVIGLLINDLSASPRDASLLVTSGTSLDDSLHELGVQPSDVSILSARNFEQFLSKATRYGELLSLMDNVHLHVDFDPNVLRNQRAGCHIIMGASGSGKSTLAVELTKKDKALLISACEPDYYSVNITKGIAKFITACCSQTERVIVVDSLRDIVYSGQGSTLSGGISSDLVNCCAILSRFAQMTLCCTYALINPLTAKDSNIDALREAVAGSSTSLIFLTYNSGDLTDYGTEHKLMVTSRLLADRKYHVIDSRNFSTSALAPETFTSASELTSTRKVLSVNVDHNLNGEHVASDTDVDAASDVDHAIFNGATLDPFNNNRF